MLHSVLILGGARSGKSNFAESLAINYPEVTYIATGVAVDGEMQTRIEKHQQDRPQHWQTIESPIHLANSLNQIELDSTCVLIDCMSFWVNNCLYNSEQTWIEQREDYLKMLAKISNPIIMVSNEISLGITPRGAETRQFVDELGRLHQRLAEHVETVVFMVAGIPQIIKGELPK